MTEDRGFPHDEDPTVYSGRMAATSVAAVVAELRRRLPDLPAVKLQKLLYYCQGHHLQAFAEPLFGEKIKAYEMGPVVPQVWKAEDLGYELRDDAAVLTEEILGTIALVVDTYGRMTGNALADQTHREPPWLTAWASKTAGQSDVLELGVMREYFQGLAPAITAETRAWLTASAARIAEPAQLDSWDRLYALRLGVG